MLTLNNNREIMFGGRLVQVLLEVIFDMIDILLSSTKIWLLLFSYYPVSFISVQVLKLGAVLLEIPITEEVTYYVKFIAGIIATMLGCWYVYERVKEKHEKNNIIILENRKKQLENTEYENKINMEKLEIYVSNLRIIEMMREEGYELDDKGNIRKTKK